MPSTSSDTPTNRDGSGTHGNKLIHNDISVAKFNNSLHTRFILENHKGSNRTLHKGSSTGISSITSIAIGSLLSRTFRRKRVARPTTQPVILGSSTRSKRSRNRCIIKDD
eukprot:scaffold9268_cov52-Attheya_sp.AAC.2